MAGISASPLSPAEAVDGDRDGDQPYISLVVATRNDDHGGNLLGRMQVFVNAWIGQCKAHGLTSELIIVEWNPPPNRPRLIEALQWPEDTGPCRVRVIQVPPEVHARYAHAKELPLYQMIAKNVGIRRARGRFVLATNVDIVFSDELVRFLGEGRLDRERMYRIDRHDVMSDVPVDASVKQQLDYCRSHVIRLNAREGTFNLTSDGRRVLGAEDIASAVSGIAFGRGWFPAEQHVFEESFRWVDNNAELVLSLPSSPPPPLLLELEPGPGVAGEPLALQVLDEDCTILVETAVEQRAELRLLLTPHHRPTRTLCLRVIGGGVPVDHDPRALNFRVFRCEWGKKRSAPPVERCQLEVAYVRTRKRGLLPRYSLRSHPLIRFYIEAGGPIRAIKRGLIWFLRRRALAATVKRGKDIFEPRSGISPGTGWYRREHFLGETFRWIRNEAELIIMPSAGENNRLGLQIEPGPGVSHDPFDLLVRNERDEIVARALVTKLQFLTIPIPRLSTQKQVFTLGVEGGGLPALHERRIMNFRLFWCGWVDQSGRPLKMADATSDVAPDWIEPLVEEEDGFERPARVPGQMAKVVAATARPGNAVFLHTNGCGDFTLMARDHWFALRGYPEFDLFSMNLDSVLCYAAHHAGVCEEPLHEPMRIYHIEHFAGSGWTPEGQDQLFRRIAAKGLTFVHYQQVVRWIADMRRFNAPLIFNLQNWGLADLQLTEQIVESKRQAQAT